MSQPFSGVISTNPLIPPAGAFTPPRDIVPAIVFPVRSVRFIFVTSPASTFTIVAVLEFVVPPSE